ncbi:AAA family ATPase [Methylobacillus caricis]|uniref:HdaA/DnaA family protein n=1 Tax=Methylobacillus caricis TaxID=1971611 RepID=UPI001D0011E0|nr:DnaA/Hda family protein [Methylobacillus caricis]MCB5188348.1 AAA family ATPase [Methylobacillus caricis]
MKQLLLDIQPPASPTLENFVVGRNAEALFQLKSTIQQDGNARFIYLWGASGCGKSHLITACNALAGQHGLNMICVDDVHLLSDEEQISLFDIYNQLRESGGSLVASGQAAPGQMGLRDDLATRLAWGLAYQLHPLSDEEKAQALKIHAQARGMKLPDEVLDYCLRHLRRDMPNLIATIDALDEWSLTDKRAVTLPLLKQLLQLSPG